MLLKLIHTTDLAYSDLISESVMELRMTPRQQEDQHRLSFTLAIGPAASAANYFDWLGNTVHTFTVNAFHKQIRIQAVSIVETDRPRAEPERFADLWPIPPSEYDYSVYDYLTFNGPIVDCPALRQLVEQVNPRAGESLGGLSLRMLLLLAEQFVFQKGITTAASPITEILAHRQGVCQDFSHLMMGLARAMGIPARYVSGMIHPDRERFRGFTQTHAWCELLFPSIGWIGFDPANNCIVGDNFVKIAIGRHFGDVPPNKGIYRGNAEESIEVSVQSEELEAIPPELAAERIDSLNIPTFPEGRLPHQEMMVNQQQEQQQQ